MRRDLLLLLGGTLIGALIGAVLADGAAGHAFAPASWFWPVAGICGGMGVVLLVVAVISGLRESAAHKKPALDLVFEGVGTPCVHDFEATAQDVPIGTTHTLVPAVTGSAMTAASVSSALATSAPLPHTLVRLHVRNLRSRSLTAVTVRLAGARRAPDGQPAHLHTDYLKWMHDDDEGHVRSLQGITVEPGNDPRAYIDLATRNRSRENFALEFAQRHLRNWSVTGPPVIYLHLIASGQEESGLHVPDCHRAFLLEATPDGGFNVVPKALSECGFL